MLDHMRLQAWDRILFVECGDGWIAEECWRRAARAYVFGVDRSSRQVAAARQLRQVPGKLEFDTWDGSRLPVPDSGFDRVMARCVPVAPGDAAALMREVQRALTPDGDAYLLHAVSDAAHLGRSLARAGLTDLRELGRSDDRSRMLTRARAGLR